MQRANLPDHFAKTYDRELRQLHTPCKKYDNSPVELMEKIPVRIVSIISHDKKDPTYKRVQAYDAIGIPGEPEWGMGYIFKKKWHHSHFLFMCFIFESNHHLIRTGEGQISVLASNEEHNYIVMRHTSIQSDHYTEITFVVEDCHWEDAMWAETKCIEKFDTLCHV